MILCNLLNFNSFVNSINKQSHKQVNKQVKANQISLNAGKTELVFFTSPKNQLDCDLKIKLTQPTFTCSMLTIETLEQGVKYVQS